MLHGSFAVGGGGGYDEDTEHNHKHSIHTFVVVESRNTTTSKTSQVSYMHSKLSIVGK